MGTKHSKEKQNKDSKLLDRILNIFRSQSNRPLRYSQITKELSMKNDTDRSFLNKALDLLESKLKIYKKPNGSFMLITPTEEYEGIVDHVNPLFGFIIVEGRDDDIRISTKNLGTALHGDKVRVVISNKKACVTKVFQRARDSFVGKVYEKNGAYYVEIDGRRYHGSIKILNKNDVQAKF